MQFRISHVARGVAAVAASAALPVVGVPAASGAHPVRATVAQDGPACNEAEAQAAVRQKPFRRALWRALGRRFARPKGMPASDEFVIGMFVLYEVECYDLTGDGHDEMIVEPACCNTSSPDPWAIFAPVGDRWRLAYHRLRANVWSVHTSTYRSEDGSHQASVEAKIPVFRRRDALCCPSRFKYAYTVYDGTRFVRRVH
jgi:hypothetical protein